VLHDDVHVQDERHRVHRRRQRLHDGPLQRLEQRLPARAGQLRDHVPGAVNECDLAEACTGSSSTCPADVVKTAGTACTDDGNVCTTDQCNGSASPLCVHNPAMPGPPAERRQAGATRRRRAREQQHVPQRRVPAVHVHVSLGGERVRPRGKLSGEQRRLSRRHGQERGDRVYRRWERVHDRSVQWQRRLAAVRPQPGQRWQYLSERRGHLRRRGDLHRLELDVPGRCVQVLDHPLPRLGRGMRPG